VEKLQTWQNKFTNSQTLFSAIELHVPNHPFGTVSIQHRLLATQL